MKNLGRRFREVRVERGMTQEALAEQLEVSVRWIQSVEGGRENVGVVTLVRFANALKTPIGDFFLPPTQPAPRTGRPRRV